MRIAVVGSGISGLASAWLLRDLGRITLYEANDYIGGHTHTVDVAVASGTWAVDTGFIVFNRRTYPNLVKLFDRLGLSWQESDMSFSVHCEKTGLEYCPSRLDTLFAQRKNLLRPRFWRMIRDILRFRREMGLLLESGNESITLMKYLREGGYSRMFIEKFLIPMGSAIWSADPRQFESFPALQFIRFFANHLFLERRQPKWRTLKGGSRRYVEKMLETLGDRVRVSCPVRRVARRGSQWEVETDSGPAECYDEVILAAHSDQALELLEAPTEAQREILSAISYQPNDVVLHTDRSLLPELRKVWASWNYRIPTRSTDRVCTSYYMNRLQALEAPEDFCVTLNMSDRIDASHVLGRFRYSHPVFTPAARGAQLRREEISGVDGLHFCGAYWGYGFHEDGLNSALAVASHFGAGL